MNLLNRAALLAKENLKVEKVELGNDEFVYVRQMTGRERDKFEQSLIKEKTKEDGSADYERKLDDFRAKLAVCTICDESGKLILGYDDYELLSTNMSAARLEKIITEAQKLNKITDTDKKNLTKNSDAGAADNSSSGSVEN